MEKKFSTTNILVDIKEQIEKSRFLAVKAVNKELILLYYKIGYLLSDRITEANWGSKILENISESIQNEFNGIRGYSVRNLKNMRQFYIEYKDFSFGQLSTAQIEFSKNYSNNNKLKDFSIGQLTTAQLGFEGNEAFLKTFFSVGFTAHILLINRCSDLNERFYYIKKCAFNQWTVELLGYHLDNNSYTTTKDNTIQNNFAQRLPEKINKDAVKVFRNDYLLNFIQIEDDNDELAVEKAIVDNVKTFMLTLGREFTFMGNQYRLVIDGDEFFVDLLFYHRGLQSMIAIELKTGKFKPEYAGKMNFYLAA